MVFGPDYSVPVLYYFRNSGGRVEMHIFFNQADLLVNFKFQVQGKEGGNFAFRGVSSLPATTIQVL